MSVAADLLELQGLDLEIVRANKRLEELPEKKAILEVRSKLREIGSLKDKASMLVRKLNSELKARQDEVSSLKDKIASEQTKIMQTTDHRAVQSITREMDGFKRRVDKLEMEELQFMERIDKASAQLSTIEEHLGKLSQREQQLIERFKLAGGEVQTFIAEKTASRQVVVARVPADVLARYDEIREARGGIGVGALEGTMCTACRMDLPAEKIKALVDGPEVGVCPQCRRLIVSGVSAT